MALNPKYSEVAVNAKANAQAALLNGGFLEIWSGTQPVTADTVLGSQVKLARLTFGSPAFGPASGGVCTANTIQQDSSATGGTAGWCRLCKTDGSVVMDGSVGLSGCNVNLDNLTIGAGNAVAITSCAFAELKG